MSTGQQGTAAPRNCVACGRAIAWDANVCPFCGHDYRPAMSGGQTLGESLDKRFHGSLIVLIILLVVCWPAAIIYYFMKRD
ncbi:MAG: hypothetical protein QG582_123 [Candidatus Thermoplasmatota archaeon]|nr:hypothetical protein [Candidatus Thermoplasmatota archaeon]